MSQQLLCASASRPLEIEDLPFTTASLTTPALALAAQQMHALGTPLWLAVLSDAPDGLLEGTRHALEEGRSIQDSPLGRALLSLFDQGTPAIALFYSDLTDDLPRAATTAELFSILAEQFAEPHPMGLELFAVWHASPGA